MRLAERLLALHRSLERAGVPHAFGGAIALAYWTLRPRGTIDIDLNLFVAPERCEEALAALPDHVRYTDADVDAIRREGQRRLWWDDTPIDLFFDYAELHEVAARHRRFVPFEGVEIPVLGPVELAAFKAMFDRTRDWADIEAMLAAETLDSDELRRWIAELAGPTDARLGRLDDAVQRAGEGRA